MAPTLKEIQSRLGVAASPTAGKGLALDGDGQIPQKVLAKISKDGVFVAQRHGLNIITGANTTLTVVDNPSSDRVDVTVAAAATSEVAGTSFPGSPVDGQVYVYRAAAGVLWRFVYNTTDTAWDFVGGPPLVSEVLADESTASTTYAALSTPGPAIALPFAGDWDIAIEAKCYNNVATNVMAMSYDIGGSGAVDADCAGVQEPGTSLDCFMARARRKTGLTAVTLTAKYKTQANTSHFVNRRMSVLPVKK